MTTIPPNDDLPAADSLDETADGESPAMALVEVLDKLGDSIDDIGATAKRGVRWQYAVVGALVTVLVACGAVAWAVNSVGNQTDALTNIALTNQSNGRTAAANTALLTRQGDDILRIARAVESATSEEARAAAAKSTGALVDGLVADIRRSIDCTTLYDMGLVPTPCADVVARLQALIDGVDPFARPAK